MVEVMIEQWSNLDGTIDFMWSVWRDGQRLEMGGAHPTAEAAEREATEFCIERFGAGPAAVTRV